MDAGMRDRAQVPPYFFCRLISDSRSGWEHATISSIMLALFVIRLLEVMFFVGLAGSSVVVFISFLEDGRELFKKNTKDE
jgi:hypothetical protein